MASVKMYKKNGDAKAVAIQENLEKNFGFLPEVFQVMGRNGEFLEHVLGVANAAGNMSALPLEIPLIFFLRSISSVFNRS